MADLLKDLEIICFVLDNEGVKRSVVVDVFAKKWGVTPQSVSKRIRKLIKNKCLVEGYDRRLRVATPLLAYITAIVNKVEERGWLQERIRKWIERNIGGEE